MKLFIDTADLDEIETYLDWGICDGVTTNPSINVACGITSGAMMKQRTVDIAKLIEPRPLSVEVTTDDLKNMIVEAQSYRDWAENIVIKITITTRAGASCLPVVRQLASDGIDVNVTAVMTVNQAILAAKAGGRYVSLFGGRIDDEGGDATTTIHNFREWLDCWSSSCPRDPQIIVGSSRTTRNVSDWSIAGAHILTVTPTVLSKLLINARTKETVTQFIEDAQIAMQSLKQE